MLHRMVGLAARSGKPITIPQDTTVITEEEALLQEIIDHTTDIRDSISGFLEHIGVAPEYMTNKDRLINNGTISDIDLMLECMDEFA